MHECAHINIRTKTNFPVANTGFTLDITIIYYKFSYNLDSKTRKVRINLIIFEMTYITYCNYKMMEIIFFYLHMRDRSFYSNPLLEEASSCTLAA